MECFHQPCKNFLFYYKNDRLSNSDVFKKVLMFKRFLTLILFCNFSIGTSTLVASSYPNKSINIIVPFGKGGSTDRMTKIMTKFLKKELDNYIKITNIKGQGTLLGTKKFLEQPQDGYTIFSSTFSPYLTNTILSKKSSYDLKDFSIINMQWFDYDLIAVNKDSSFNNLLNLLDTLKNGSKKLKVALMYRSSGHLLLKLILEKFAIPKENVKIVFFNGGEKAREALLKNKVDFIVISAQGSSTVKEFIKPLAVAAPKRTKKWDAPTLNNILAQRKIYIPHIPGSMRGFAVSKEFKEKYPKRYLYLLKTFKQVLATKRVQTILKHNNIGYIWLGPDKSNELLLNSFKLFQKYNHLLNDEK